MAISPLRQVVALVAATHALLLSSVLPAQASVSFLSPGLTGRYFDSYWNGDPNFFSASAPVFSRTDNYISYGDAAFNSGNPALSSWGFAGTSLADEDTFSVEWIGQLVVNSSESYDFRTFSDDGIQVLINNNPVVSNPTLHPPTEDLASIFLAAGVYPFKAYYGENTGLSVASLEWKPTSAVNSAYALVTTASPSPNTSSVPGPLPLLGAAAAFRASRRLRARRHRSLKASINSVRFEGT